MATKGQMTGMLGTYLAAAELTQKGLIVSITSRNARGADLLVTDKDYEKTLSIQVKTNRKAATFWLLNKAYKELKSATHLYVFVNLHGKERPLLSASEALTLCDPWNQSPSYVILR
jgi:hypothetical protein